MSSNYTPGYGDEETWGACTGHPHDPRTVIDEDAEGLRWLIEEASALIGRAERAMVAGDMQAAIDLLRSAGAELSNADWA